MGASRSSFPGLPSPCSGTPGPSLCHPEAFFAYFTHFHLGKKGPFSKTELKHLSSRQIPSSILKTHLKPSPRHHCVASVQGRVDHSLSTPLCWGQFWCFEVSPTCWVGMHLSSFPHAEPGSAPWTLPPIPTSNRVSFTPIQPCSISCWVELSPLAPHPLLSSQGTTLPSTPSLASLLIALSSSQLCKMSGTGSALADQATRTAACPPSMHCCRPRSCPSRYWDDPLPTWGSPTPRRGLASTPVLSSQVLKQQLEGSWDITEGKPSPVSHSQLSSKGRTQTRVWHTVALSSPSLCMHAFCRSSRVYCHEGLRSPEP